MHTALLFITAGAYWLCKCIEKLLLYSLGKHFNRRPRNCGVTCMSSVQAKITCQRQEILGEQLSEKVDLPPLSFLPSPLSSLLGDVYVSPLHACSPLMRCKFMCVRNNVQSGAFLLPRSRERIEAPSFLRNLRGRDPASRGARRDRLMRDIIEISIQRG